MKELKVEANALQPAMEVLRRLSNATVIQVVGVLASNTAGAPYFQDLLATSLLPLSSRSLETL